MAALGRSGLFVVCIALLSMILPQNTRHDSMLEGVPSGKTRVLVERYVNLLGAGIDPDHILAITFTRKAAAEMRQRIVERLKEAGRTSELDAARWRDLRGRLGDIAISTIDAFCLALLREFPLEADVDPAFELADDTEVPRLVEDKSSDMPPAHARE